MADIDDNNRFRYFALEPLAVMPDGISMPLEIKTSAELVAERRAWLDSTKRCECCGGKGRVLI